MKEGPPSRTEQYDVKWLRHNKGAGLDKWIERKGQRGKGRKGRGQEGTGQSKSQEGPKAKEERAD